MRYQIRLIDQNLPGLAREIATACWRAADGALPEPVGEGMYRALCRVVRTILKDHVEAFRFCGATRACEFSIPRKELAKAPAHEAFAGEHVHVYLMDPETPAQALAAELLSGTLRAIVARLPGRRLKGLSDLLKNEIGKALQGRIFEAHYCGDQQICHANESYDPWDLTDPTNQVHPAAL